MVRLMVRTLGWFNAGDGRFVSKDLKEASGRSRWDEVSTTRVSGWVKEAANIDHRPPVSSRHLFND